MRILVPLVVIVALAFGVAQPASAAPTKHQVQALKAQVKTLKRERNEWRSKARDAQAAITSGLPAQIAELAKGGQITALHNLIIEPIRVNWPCGSTLYQGEWFYSVDVNLEKTEYNGDEFVKTSCRG